jgi:hemoglobin
LTRPPIWANIITIGKGRNRMQSTTPETGKTLYERLGGYDAIAAIVDEFLGRLRADPMFARFGGGRSSDSTRRGREFLVSQMCELSGGPCKYFGRDMKTAHGGLAITTAEWEACLRHTADALDHLKVTAKAKEEFLALFERYRDEIVEA